MQQTTQQNSAQQPAVTATTSTSQPLTNQHSLEDWLTYIYGIHVSAIDMGLSRVLPVFEQLALGQPDAFVFTVAGTNGKGSTTATIAQICQQAGYKTALYQSPHLMRFNERIKINGEMVSDQTLIDAFVQVEAARLACGLTLSFFEMTTLAALLIFAKADCDVWVLEIGLGGRLDVVNIIDPNLAVITNIGIDHVEWLGDTREKIAVEKAGILRDDVTLVYGEADMPATLLPLIEKHRTPVLQYGQDYAYQPSEPNESHETAATWLYSNAAATIRLPLPNLSLHNTATAITAVLASGLAITTQTLSQALPKVQLAGRFDRRHIAQRQWVFDVAHNEHGIRFLLSQFVPFWQAYHAAHPDVRLHLLLSMLVDKDINSVLTHLTTLPIKQVVSAPLDNPRATTAEQLQQILPRYFANPVVLADMQAATEQILAVSQPNDVILVCGSFHTIAEALHALTAINEG